jgi:hypothetical protein
LITHNLFIGGKPPQGVKYGGYSPGRGRAADLQSFGEHCIIDHNAYAVIGMPFEGKIRTLNLQKLPGTDFEKHGRSCRRHPFHCLKTPQALRTARPLRAHGSWGLCTAKKCLSYGPRSMNFRLSLKRTKFGPKR